MIPVWPVARKSASSPRAANARAIASAVYFLPSAQSVPTVSRRLPLRLRPVPMGIFGGGHADVDQPAAEAFCRPLQSRNVGEPRMHPADDIEPRLERLFERRDPAWRDEPARVRHADHQRPCAACARLARGRGAAAPSKRSRRGAQTPRRTALPPNRAARTRSWQSPGRSCRRGTGGRAAATVRLQHLACASADAPSACPASHDNPCA